MNNDFYGWTGKHIRVDLTKSNIEVVPDDPSIMKAYIGTRGIGIKYILDEIDPKNGYQGRIWLDHGRGILPAC